MKLFAFCLLIGVAYGSISTIVTVNKPGILANDGATVVLPCEYEMLPSEDQPPIIYWMKGVSVDDPDAIMIFEGFRYWNESLGEYRQFYGDYEKRGFAVADLKSPSLKMPALFASDEGRYWCMVAEWSGRQQEGTDADSVALVVGKSKPYIDAQTPVNQTIDEGDDAILQCEVYYETFDAITWYTGPFHLADNENFTHTEIGTYNKIGQRTDKTVMESTYAGVMTINNLNQLVISKATVEHAGRYWCEASKTSPSNRELDTDRASVQLIINVIPFSCVGQVTGLYPDAQDCSMYYECVEGDTTTYHRSCGYDGLVFDDVHDYCDWAANLPPPCGTMSE